MQVTVESCFSVCISPLQKSIKKIVEKDYPDSTPEELKEFFYKELKKFSVNDQTFEYVAVDNYLGGYRWFFLCPRCGKQCGKLFLPPQECKNREAKYLCKNCHRLKNQSAIMSQSNIYKKVTRPLKRMKDIEDKISRGHLRNEKVQELLNEYETIEKELRASPEFRLYTFKKKHSLL